MAAQAVALRPQLLKRALELCGRRDADAEDLVQDAYLAMIAKPPSPRTPSQLKHWLRSVMRNQQARAYRARRGVETVSLDVLQEARASQG